MSDKKPKKGFFYFLGCVAKVIFGIIKIVFMVLFKLFKTTGLYLPAAYAVCGCALYLMFGFNPLAFADPEVKLECILFAIGFGLCAFCAVIISVQNLIVRPIAGFMNGAGLDNRNDKIDKKVQKRQPKQDEEEPKPIKEEKPKVYYSELQNRMVYEYSDRYEVYIKKSGQEILEKVEYKID